MSDVPTLKPCPAFRHAEVALMFRFGRHYGLCKKCDWRGPYAKTKAEAVAAWNRRIKDPTLGEVDLWLREQVDRCAGDIELAERLRAFDEVRRWLAEKGEK